ncbi:Endo-1,4-beta-xylanase [Madurella fahalii]|uniref:Endo-1,4-beta-xylanase n=1 Tax=Madurella fahalii TaxID=1157608 RepID=A0ABQ0GGJ1_9PEZI
MHLLTSLLTTVLITVTFAAPSAKPKAAHAISSALARADQGIKPGTGTSGGFFYYFWSDNVEPVTYNNHEGGRYTVKWGDGTGNFVAGKGWNSESVDTLKTVVYNGTWSTTGNAYLSLYGFTSNPMVEYYILENYGSYDPSTTAEKKGSVTSDGEVYNIHTRRFILQDLEGARLIHQVLSIRQTKRTAGTITPKNHFDAWRNLNVTLGKHDFAVLATEGYRSSGEADITVGERTA